MGRRLGSVILAAWLLFGYSGCTRESAPSAPPPGVAPTVDEAQAIAAELRQLLAPVTSSIAPAGSGVPEEATAAAQDLLTDDVRAQVVGSLKVSREKYGNSEKGREAIAQVCVEIEKMMQEARDQQRWGVVLGGVEAYEALTGIVKERSKERAEMYLSRPKVKLKGFLDDIEKNDLYAFLKITLRPSREVKQVQVRAGEEFEGLRFVRIIGNRKGVLLEYLDTPGDTFQVMLR